MAAFAIAKELGYVDVDRMLESIDSNLFREWVAYLSMKQDGTEMKSAESFELDARQLYGGNR
jgi:hypothetical protein